MYHNNYTSIEVNQKTKYIIKFETVNILQSIHKSLPKKVEIGCILDQLCLLDFKVRPVADQPKILRKITMAVGKNVDTTGERVIPEKA